MKTVQYFVVSIALTLGAAAGLAQDETEAPVFESVDVDRDGYISVVEAQQSEQIAGMFAELDSDKDGKISADEYGKVTEIE